MMNGGGEETTKSYEMTEQFNNSDALTALFVLLLLEAGIA
jgi:hypothetical protein